MKVGSGTTTLGTWLSSSIEQVDYCRFANKTFQPFEDLHNLSTLPDLKYCYDTFGNLVFLDTEGLDYQTELGRNYDIVSILPHALAAENVFLVVRDRLNPAEGRLEITDYIFQSKFIGLLTCI